VHANQFSQEKTAPNGLQEALGGLTSEKKSIG
jgi:hypothetical protein